MILLPRKGYLQQFGFKIVKIVRCYCHDLGQSERNIFDFSLCVTEATSLIWSIKRHKWITGPQLPDEIIEDTQYQTKMLEFEAI